MSKLLLLWVCVTGLLVAGCGSDELPVPAAGSPASLFGSDITALQAQAGYSDLRLTIKEVPSAGIFFAIPMGASGIQNESWNGDRDVLHLAVPYQGRLEIGIYPLRSYAGGAVEATIGIVRNVRQASDPPHGAQNKVADLTVTELSGGRVRLEWTEVNTGDYNVDGIVNLQDIVPLGMYFGLTSTDADWDVAQVADGDRDGRVSLSDLNRIGANYYSEIAGYIVKHAASNAPPPWPVITPEPLQRSDFENRPYPPHYVFETNGSVDDEWAVAPVDRFGIEGIGSDDATVDRIDVFSSLAYSGSDLWLLDGSSFGALALNGYLMRIIDPGEWPGRMPIVPAIDGPLGILFFDGLPRRERLMLDFVYAPVINPATGDPAPYTDQLITSVPFELPASDQQLQISADIQLVPNAGSGPAYWLDSHVTQDILGQQVLRHTRLDMASFLVTSDTTGDGGFGDEAWLFDADRDSVSDSLLLRQQEYNAYDVYGAGELQPVLLRGTANYYNMYDGMLVIGDDAEFYNADAGLWGPIPDAPILVRFSEQTNFAELVNPGPNEFERNFNPATLAAGDSVLVYGFRLVDPTALLDFHYWADRVLRKVTQ